MLNSCRVITRAPTFGSCIVGAKVDRNFFTAGPLQKFYEYHPKGEYKDRVNQDPKEEAEGRRRQRANLYGLKDGFKDLRVEIDKWSNEWKERLTVETIVNQGDRTVVWNFQEPDILNKWTTACDSDFGEGYSRCELTKSPTGKALFQGFVNTRPPEDGKIKKAGFAAMRCHRIMKSFNRESHLDWTCYTHLVMRVRGDGRNYNITISTAGEFDITWNDSYHYVLYTRGGPYWQYVKIPFSKFVFGSKGRVQDTQEPLRTDRIAALGLAVGQVDGPFSLEVDWIGVECDLVNLEETAYEMYRIPPFVANV